MSILAPEKTAEKRPKTDPKTTPNRPHFDPLMLHSAALNRRCRLRRCAWRLDTEPTTPQVSKCGVVRPDNFWKLLGLQAGSLSNVVVAEYDYAGNLHQPDPVEGRELTNEEKLQIASEVIDGKRPRSDLQKYGRHVGESHVLTTEEKQQFLNDIEAMEAAT